MRALPFTLLGLSLLIAVPSCKRNDDSADDDTGFADTDTDTDADADADTDPDNGDTHPDRVADEIFSGNLSDGATLSSLAWASSVYCWPATENVNFNGAHVFYERTQPATRDFYVRVDPENDVDISVYYIQRSAGSTAMPPNIELGVVFDCDATYDMEHDDNPGQPEVLYIQGYNEYSLIIGIAGADGATTGKFDVEIWDEQGPF